MENKMAVMQMGTSLTEVQTRAQVVLVVDSGGRGGSEETGALSVYAATPEETPAQSVSREEQSITNTHMFPARAEDRIQSHPESHTTMSPTPTQSHSDLYTSDLPSYTQTASIGERSIDAQAVRISKATASPECLPPYKAYSTQLSPKHHVLSKAGSVRSSDAKQLQQSGAISVHNGPVPIRADKLFLAGSTPAGGPMHTRSLIETNTATHADLTSIRRCSLLQNRPAVWFVRRKNTALSALAGAVLTKDGLLEAKDLQLITTELDTYDDPTDPFSGIIVGCYDLVGDIVSGLAAGPVELSRQANRKDDAVHPDDASIGSKAKGKDVARASGQVAMGTAKGLGKVVTTSLKSPMLIMHGVTRGFHNLPKTYGEEVRQYETVTGFRSGLSVSAKSFGHGMGDGMRDLIAKPIDGAEKNGIVGFGTGLATGFANLMCKPTAGVCGLVSYSSLGVYRSIQKVGASKKDDPAEEVRRLGEEERRELCDADRLAIVRLWCQMQMRVSMR